MSDIDRRRFLTYLGAGLATIPTVGLLDACSSSTSKSGAANGGATSASAPVSLGSATYQLSWLKDSQWTGEYQADTKGYWTNQGLKVTMLAGGSNVDPTASVVAGKALTGPPAAAPAAAAITKGADLKIVATKYQQQPLAIVSLASNPITTVADLKGKTIGVDEFNTVTFDTFLSLNNMSPGDLKVVPYNFDPSMLSGKHVDGLLGYVNDEPTSLGAKGFQTHSLVLSDNGYDVISNAYVVDSAALADAKRRAQLVALFTGIVKGWTDVIADPAGLTPGLLAKYSPTLGISSALGIATVKATCGLIKGSGSVADIYAITPATMQNTISVLAVQKSKLAASDFDLTFMQDVQKSL
jgi:ABC-type nitrate/sulfonate/bicarbonate transport system substrate-binding protein